MRWGLLFAAAACIIRLWLMTLGSSFWVDEMATIFVVEHGAHDPSLNVAPQVPQSIYYAAVRATNPGRSEVAYRLPSIFFMAAALWFLALLAGRLIHPDAKWFTFFAALSLKGLNYEAANARPYAMGICIAAAGFYFLVRWLDQRRWVDAALFIVFAALLWRVHLIFWPFYVVFALCALARRNGMEVWKIAAVFAAVGILLIPVAIDAWQLNTHAKEHVVIAKPTLAELTRSLHLTLVAAAAAGAWIWSRFARRSAGIAASAAIPILAWWLAQPAALFAYSWLTGNSVFVPRYLALSLPGTALAAALAASIFLPSRFWKPAAILMAAGALIFAGNWKNLWPEHHNSDWRGAANAVNALKLPPSVPVICPSPFIEARPPEWTPDYKMPGFLYSHLLVYPVRGNAVLFPFADSPEAEQYAAALTHGAIPAVGRFVIFGGNQVTHFWRDWFENRPELAGWSHRELGQFLDVHAVLFERPR